VNSFVSAEQRASFGGCSQNARIRNGAHKIKKEHRYENGGHENEAGKKTHIHTVAAMTPQYATDE